MSSSSLLCRFYWVAHVDWYDYLRALQFHPDGSVNFDAGECQHSTLSMGGRFSLVEHQRLRCAPKCGILEAGWVSIEYRPPGKSDWSDMPELEAWQWRNPWIYYRVRAGPFVLNKDYQTDGDWGKQVLPVRLEFDRSPFPDETHTYVTDGGIEILPSRSFPQARLGDNIFYGVPQSLVDREASRRAEARVNAFPGTAILQQWGDRCYLLGERRCTPSPYETTRLVRLWAKFYLRPELRFALEV